MQRKYVSDDRLEKMATFGYAGSYRVRIQINKGSIAYMYVISRKLNAQQSEPQWADLNVHTYSISSGGSRGSLFGSFEPPDPKPTESNIFQ